MAANYWDSTQRRNWLFTKDELADMRQKIALQDAVLAQKFPLDEPRILSIWFRDQLMKLGRRLTVRQQALATAQVYLKRFYLKNEMRRTNPYLFAATALYVACKTEECPQHIRIVSQEARALWPEVMPQESAVRIGECEFFLISEMSSQLIVHHPYRTLADLKGDFLSEEDFMLVWNVINDHYLTDLPLLYAPHVVAVAAMVYVLVLSPPSSSFRGSSSSVFGSMNAGTASAVMQQAQVRAVVNIKLAAKGVIGHKSINAQRHGRMERLKALQCCVAESGVGEADLADCCQEIISIYTLLNEFQNKHNEKQLKEQMTHFVKVRGLNK